MSVNLLQCSMLAVSESVLLVMELSLGVTGLRAIFSSLDPFVVSIGITVAIVWWMGRRGAHRFALHTPRMFLTAIGAYRIPLISFTALCVMLAHVSGLVLVFFIQRAYSMSILTLGNFYVENDWSWGRALDVIIGSPIREEILFRGILVNIFHSRFLQFDSFTRTFMQVLGPGLVFSLVHLLNLAGSRFSVMYIALQLVLGLAVGIFYNIRFMQSNTIYEPLLLHIVNNLCSSFVDPGIEFNTVMLAPCITTGVQLVLTSVIVVQTLILYAVLDFYGFQTVVAKAAWLSQSEALLCRIEALEETTQTKEQRKGLRYQVDMLMNSPEISKAHHTFVERVSRLQKRL